MIDRRSHGTLNLHLLLIAFEAMALWGLLSVSGMSFTTLLPYPSYLVAIVVGVVASGQYSGRLRSSLMALNAVESSRLALRQTVCIYIVIFTVVVVLKDPGISRAFLATYLAALFVMLAFVNRFQPRWIAWRLFEDKAKVRTLLIGGTARFPDFPLWLSRQRTLGLEPVGTVSYHGESAVVKGAPLAGSFEQIDEIIARTGARKVVMLDQPENSVDANMLVKACVVAGSRLLIHNNFGYRLRYPLTTLQSEAYSFFTLHDEPLEDPFNRCVKRLLDLAISLTVVLFLLPPLAFIVWLMQRIQSPGPLFYSHYRTGHNQSRFKILKFRSMHDHAHHNPAQQASKGDARVYPFGRFLRRTSLDELPQFINVLRGEMSTVGPRPHLVAHDESFSQDVDVYLMRFFAKPGITGLAQCNGYRGETGTRERLEGRIQLDLEYIRSWSIWMDIWIICRTTRQVLFPPKNAY